jgi:ADP-ribosylglycohydrolase
VAEVFGDEQILHQISDDQFEGCLLATALGDAIAAPYEGGVMERLLWRVLGKRKGLYRWTDDTQMTLDVAASLIRVNGIDQDDLAKRFAQSYAWSRGYGPAASRTLKQIKRGMRWQDAAVSKYPDGSFGNGGAMRVAPIGLFFANASNDVLRLAARQSAVVTHAHPLGQTGAELMAMCVAMAAGKKSSLVIVSELCDVAWPEPYATQLRLIAHWLPSEKMLTPEIIVKETGNGILATRSCVTAMYAALSHIDASFEQLLAWVIRLGGDTDTLASMAGGIWGAANGASALPSILLDTLEQCQRIRRIASELYFATQASMPANGKQTS